MLSAILSVLLQATNEAASYSELAAAFAAALTAFGAAYGISKIGVSAMEAIARQPEASGDIRSNMIVSAALIEGVSFLLLLCVRWFCLCNNHIEAATSGIAGGAVFFH